MQFLQQETATDTPTNASERLLDGRMIKREMRRYQKSLTHQLGSRRIPIMVMSSNLEVPSRNVVTSAKQLATSRSAGMDRDAVVIWTNLGIPYSSPVLFKVSRTPSVYKRRVSPASSFTRSMENF